MYDECVTFEHLPFALPGRVDLASNDLMNDVIIVTTVLTALAFDFTNGFHDTANAMATSIATRALKPRIAVLLSAVLNLVGAFLSIAVAATIASGIVDQNIVTPTIVFAGLVGAIVWNLTTWLLGLPSSSSHALIGGMIGSTLVAVGTGAVKFDGVISKVLIPAVISPVLAGAVAALATLMAKRITRRADQARSESAYRRGQIASASLVSLAHGTNDAQKTMGVITLALISGGVLAAGSDPPIWVIVSAGLSIAAGTYLGGWRIIRTVGSRLTHVSPTQGFTAETTAASVLLVSAHFGFPLSTTQVCAGGVVGSGLGARNAVNWRLAGRMVSAWVVTLPAAAVSGGAIMFVADTIGGDAGVLITAIIAIAFAAGMYLLSRRTPVTADNVNDVPPIPAPTSLKAAA